MRLRVSLDRKEGGMSDTDWTFAGRPSAAGRLKIKILPPTPPDPTGLARWTAWECKWIVIQEVLGDFTAAGREDAMQIARKRWPDVKRIAVTPSEHPFG